MCFDLTVNINLIFSSRVTTHVPIIMKKDHITFLIKQVQRNKKLLMLFKSKISVFLLTLKDVNKNYVSME